MNAVLKLKPSLINGNGKVKALEETIMGLEKENASLKTRIEVLQKNFEGMSKIVQDQGIEILEVQKKLGIRTTPVKFEG